MPKLLRTPLGKPIGFGLTANAVDTVALLAGVSHGSVVKVLAALQAIHCATEVDPYDLIDANKMPEQSVRFDGSENVRVDATRALAEMVARSQDAEWLEPILRMRGRILRLADGKTVTHYG